MKTARLFVVALVGVFLLGSPALAREAGPGQERHQRKHDRQERIKDLYERLVKELDLTAEQQTQIKQILETHRQAVENWRKEHGEDLKALHEQAKKAREEKDEEARKALRKKGAGVFKERRELQESMHKQVKAVLTEEQAKKFEKITFVARHAAMGAHRLHAALRQVDPSEEQEKKVRKILAETKEAAAGVEKPGGKAELWRKAVKNIAKVLTPEQAEKFERALRRSKHRGMIRRAMADLDLTDAQKEQMEKIESKYRDKIKNADPDDRRELMKKMFEEMESVLTDEQKAELKERRGKFAGPLACLDLTDAQKEKINNIRKEYRGKIREADGDDRRELMKKMRDEIHSVLTDEQKAKLKEHRPERKRRFRERRDRDKDTE